MKKAEQRYFGAKSPGNISTATGILTMRGDDRPEITTEDKQLARRGERIELRPQDGKPFVMEVTDVIRARGTYFPTYTIRGIKI